MKKVTLIATAAFGLEAIVKREVQKLGYENVRVEDGKIIFEGDLLAIARSNLWLRSADRVKLVIGEFKATTFDELFEKTKALPWGDWISEDAEFPVSGKSIKSTLYSVPDCQAIVKKAVVESLKNKYNVSWFDEDGPLYKIEVAILKDIVTLTIDTSGAGLHKRGYRDHIGTAPLKETMAAALIQLSYWNPDRLLVDPLCGSGTIPIEAALIGKNIAPGMNRSFASEEWPVISKDIWREARKETHDLANFDRKLQIIGTDIDEEVLKVARRNASEAFVEDDIHFQKMPVNEWRSAKKYGVIICNPPYGERLSEEKEIINLYKEMGKAFRAHDSWSYYIITSYEEFEKAFGKRADRKRKLYNGNIKIDYYQYYGPRPPKRDNENTKEDAN
ncbi:putative N6-adenine-specific DNA methylase [Desulfonispora thiosulfatigenes DSM 11270]|uniref:Putative N6-adenine-specific DNA methylase n=1 Tax=Desulfonispora thiosulfatigenes DSM 11270 TaxID=656914 RepID=A0A1W1VCS3_DESTI|nr:class I SAM-dependent RNA methyltransferase [Desulfonispora thiosulfatigenes]SMB91116.1 putative N6-adenine-specific DNA methylase [Desulfonispora thiosulfatigenes DSM 11270]